MDSNHTNTTQNFTGPRTVYIERRLVADDLFPYIRIVVAINAPAPIGDGDALSAFDVQAGTCIRIWLAESDWSVCPPAFPSYIINGTEGASFIMATLDGLDLEIDRLDAMRQDVRDMVRSANIIAKELVSAHGNIAVD